MTTTTNLGLKKPDSTDPIDISVLNENADTLDAFAGETNTALAAKQDTIADLADIRSGAAAGATAVQQTTFETDQQRQDALEAEDRAALVELVDSGAKNLLIYSGTTGEIDGVTFTVNADGSVTANGQATANVVFQISSADYVNTSWIVSGCPSSGSLNSYCIQVRNENNNVLVSEYGEGRVLTDALSNVKYKIVIRIANGYTADNLVFRPMICTKAAWNISQAFVPYAPTNRELYEMIAALTARVEALENA